MSTKSKSAAKSAPKTPAAVKAAPTALKSPAVNLERKARQVPAGTMDTTVGPKGGKLVDTNPNAEQITEEQRQGERRQQNTIAQFVDTSLQTPAAHGQLTEQQQKEADFKQAALELAKEMGVDAGALLAKTTAAANRAANKVSQNNITRPGAGTETGKVWDAADEITTTQRGAAAQISQVREHKLTHGMNEHTIKTQFARWRAFHGVHGRAPLVKVVAQPSPPGQYDGIPELH